MSLDWWIFLVVKTMRRDIDREERRSRGREKKRARREGRKERERRSGQVIACNSRSISILPDGFMKCCSSSLPNAMRVPTPNA